MKNLLNKTSLAIVLLSLTSCYTESIEQELINENVMQNTFTCTDSNPEARFTNNGTVVFSFKVYNENFIQIVEQLNIAPGESTSWTSFPEGNILFSIENEMQGASDMKKQIFMSNCTSFDVTVNADNTLNDNVPVSQ